MTRNRHSRPIWMHPLMLYPNLAAQLSTGLFACFRSPKIALHRGSGPPCGALRISHITVSMARLPGDLLCP
ncbi:hypothetical protein D3C81_2096160 [compost metagenome]